MFRTSMIVAFALSSFIVTSAAQAGFFSTGTVSTPSDVQQGSGSHWYAENENGPAVTIPTPGGAAFAAGSSFSGGAGGNVDPSSFTDTGLNTLMSSYFYGLSSSATLSVTSGHSYNLEMLFFEPFASYRVGDRVMDITVGSDHLNGFDIIATTGGYHSNEGAKVDYSFTATGGSIGVTLAFDASTADHNVFTDGFSLLDTTVITTPEPNTLVLSGLGTIGLAWAARRRRRSA